jgi:acetyl-CoA C-acetyltransferase
MAVQSGLVDIAMAVGVEKISDQGGSAPLTALSTGMDADYEAIHGVTPAGLAAMMMRRYMFEYGLDVADFAGFSVNAHANGAANPMAMFRNYLKAERFAAGPVVADPVSLFDAAPLADGSAAVIVARSARAMDMVPRPVKIAGSAMATDHIGLHDRKNILHLRAAELSAQAAMAQAGITPEDVDLFELHDSFTVMAALSLEASGFAEPGQGWKLAAEGQIGRDGKVPISTFGGLKARGNPAGATGLYQIVEVALQLRGQAGDNQVPEARIGMAQNLGGVGATAVTHVLRYES